MGRGGGAVVSVSASYSEEAGLILADCNIIKYLIRTVRKDYINEKRGWQWAMF